MVANVDITHIALHRPTEMRLAPAKTRQDCWNLMGPKIQHWLQRNAGTAIEWNARMDSIAESSRPAAVMFGDHGLCIAEPRVAEDHRPVYSLSCYVLDPRSLRSTVVNHRPDAVGLVAQQARPSAPGPSGRIKLTEPQRGLLGNLPPQAQRLVQAPFLGGQEILRCDWDYRGSQHQLDFFLLYLAGKKEVTVACGTKMVPVGHSDLTAHWVLRVYRATVVRRIGR